MSAAIAELSAPQSLGMPPGLDQISLTTMVRDVIRALPVGANASAREIAALQEGAVTAALDFRPRNPREVALAITAVNANRASAECFYRATLPDVPDDTVLRFLGKAASLARLSMSAAAALQSLQRQPAPPVVRAGSAATLIAAMLGRPAGQAVGQPAADTVSGGKDPMHRETAASHPDPAAPVGKDPMHQKTAASHPGPAAQVGKDPMHREDAAPQPGPAAQRRKDSIAGGTSMLALAAVANAGGVANAGKHPMHRETPALPPFPIAGAAKDPTPGGAPRPRLAIEMPPTAEEQRNARIADDLARLGREAALARAG